MPELEVDEYSERDNEHHIGVPYEVGDESYIAEDEHGPMATIWAPDGRICARHMSVNATSLRGGCQYGGIYLGEKLPDS
jgi:hypothetical protein